LGVGSDRSDGSDGSDESDRTPHPQPPTPLPYLVTPAWVEQRRREWGEDSDAFRVRVLGEFPRASADSLIALEWVERAEGHGIHRDAQDVQDAVVFGLDVARFGDCETVLAVRRGDTLAALERWAGADLMATCGRVAHAARRERPARIVVDAVGLGAGVVDRLREIQREGELPGCEIVAFSSGERADDPARFRSRRDEAYWELRRRYQDGEIVHAAAWSALTGQLTGLRYRFTSRGQIDIESKDDLRRRGIPSPDQADAVALAFAPEPPAPPAPFAPAALGSTRAAVSHLPPLRSPQPG
jgi:phage terminase large subunit